MQVTYWLTRPGPVGGVRRRVGEDLADEHSGDVPEVSFPSELQDMGSPVAERLSIRCSLRVGTGQPVERRQQPAPVFGGKAPAGYMNGGMDF